MNILLTVGLPVSLAIIMLSLGLGLRVEDFTRIVKVPKAFAIGAILQVVVLPVLAFIVLLAVSLPPALAFGFMLLAFCPGGVTSNILTRLAGGTLALSITLTAVVSLLSVLTVPILVSWSATYFMGLDAPDVNTTSLGISMFLIAAVPVGIGVALNHLAPRVAAAIEPIFAKLAVVLFVVIVVAALASNWTLFITNLPTLGPLLIGFNIAMLAIGYGGAVLAGLSVKDGVAIALEAGQQNSTVGIAIAGIIAGASATIPEFAIPAGVYGLTMYAVALPFVWWSRRKVAAAA
ncbi:MAG: bile acid:sodium symporter [Pseudomonadota bacterium]